MSSSPRAAPSVPRPRPWETQHRRPQSAAAPPRTSGSFGRLPIRRAMPLCPSGTWLQAGPAQWGVPWRAHTRARVCGRWQRSVPGPTIASWTPARTAGCLCRPAAGLTTWPSCATNPSRAVPGSAATAWDPRPLPPRRPLCPLWRAPTPGCGRFHQRKMRRRTSPAQRRQHRTAGTCRSFKRFLSRNRPPACPPPTTCRSCRRRRAGGRSKHYPREALTVRSRPRPRSRGAQGERAWI
mmetsp:Transcript_30685/g.75277  ORF Transcript_30685/g.75277 Transcript_30685/m.75277 type:complete len:238 (-) Transcript_30685:905-1618(-)